MALTRLIQRNGAPTCGHHWHVEAAGWRCCWCPGTTARTGPPPTSRTDLCLTPSEHADESVHHWLAPARRLPLRHSHRIRA